uniref:EGF-like domain-containing protein n=1 Tax=Megaselia scalaris TaxID=36166 RepID=T1G9Y3_MEGSC
ETTLCNPNPCGVNSECFVKGNSYSCKCIRDYIGNPFEECRPECVENSQCLANKACINSKCLDPCATSPCGIDSECYVNNHIPVCVCIKGYTGDAFKQCTGITVRENDCDGNICGPNAQCKIVNGRGICECLSGFFGDPYNIGCKPECVISSDCPKNKLCLKSKCRNTPGCVSNDDCTDNEACINNKCRDPCNCANNSQCQVKNHRAICSCEPGFEECYMEQNRPLCRCKSGYRGNPFVECKIIECLTNSDCPTNKQCSNEKCINPCIYNNKCGAKAECFVQNHKDICRCPQGYYGNPFVKCMQNTEECVIDSDCPESLACINARCVNPCHQLEPCSRPSTCAVISSKPMRTMICTCPDGYVSSGSGTCKPTKSIVEIGCISDVDCDSTKTCVAGICKNPCDSNACGSNAECRIKAINLFALVPKDMKEIQKLDVSVF